MQIVCQIQNSPDTTIVSAEFCAYGEISSLSIPDYAIMRVAD